MPRGMPTGITSASAVVFISSGDCLECPDSREPGPQSDGSAEVKSCFLNGGLSKVPQRESESWFWVVPQNSCGVTDSELSYVVPPPLQPLHLWLPHPHSHSLPHAPISTLQHPSASQFHYPIHSLLPG